MAELPPELKQLLSEAFAGDSNVSDKAKISADIQARRLLDHLADFQKQHTFKPGDLIQWKKGLRNAKAPNDGQPAVVVEVMESPETITMNDGDFAGTPYVGERRDLRIGVLDSDNDFLMYMADSRMYEPYQGEVYDYGMMDD